MSKNFDIFKTNMNLMPFLIYHLIYRLKNK